MMLAQSPFNDGRGRYPDRIEAAAPRGFRDQVRRAAAAERISMGEFVRRAISQRVAAVTPPDDDPPPFTSGGECGAGEQGRPPLPMAAGMGR
jgi:hypothetical protein